MGKTCAPLDVFRESRAFKLYAHSICIDAEYTQTTTQAEASSFTFTLCCFCMVSPFGMCHFCS